MTRWTLVEGLPKGFKIKMDVLPLKKFDGICKFTILASNNKLVMEQLNIEFPLTQDYWIPEPSEGVYP